MKFDKTIIPAVMDSILARTREVLEAEAHVSVLGAEHVRCDAKMLTLHDVTAIAGLGGPIGLLIAFSFERSLLDVIFSAVAAGIEVPEDELEMHVRDAAAEIINMVLGLCTGDFQNIERSIALSPPVVVEDARRIHRPKSAVFASMRIKTDRGTVGVGIVGPRELFDDAMNYQPR